jgi:TonB family protein
MRRPHALPAVLLTAAAVLAAAAPAAALAARPLPSVYVPPRLMARPSAEDMARYYPSGAARKELAGRAVIECRVALSGAAEACRVVSETPPGEGFGAAALKLSGGFRFSPAQRGGRPVDGQLIRMPLNFRLEGDGGVLPPAAPSPSAAAPARPRSSGGFDWTGLFVILGVFGWVASRMPGGMAAWGRRVRWAYDRANGLYRTRKAEEEAVMNEAPARATGKDPVISDALQGADPGPARPAPAPPLRPTGAAPPIVQQVGRGPEPQDGIVSSAGGFRWPFGRK